MTQERMAERLGVSVQWVSRVESGENLTLHTLAKLARILGVEVNAIFASDVVEPAEAKRKKPAPPRRPTSRS